MKARLGPDGLHFFDRRTGFNMLLDEVKACAAEWSAAPRQVSIALTNACDLRCAYCYAPKHKASLQADTVERWLCELDQAGCHGVGFGGGEPTLHPQFSEICRRASRSTELAITFTTHGHRLVPKLLDELAGHVHFIRVSVDGVGQTYEAQRGRSYEQLVERLHAARQVAPIGINVVVNRNTVPELQALADLAHSVRASEVLLLPQQATGRAPAADAAAREDLARWVGSYRGQVRLAVSEAGADGLMTCQPLPQERGLRSYAHIDAGGTARASSYAEAGVPIGTAGVLPALAQLETLMEKAF